MTSNVAKHFHSRLVWLRFLVVFHCVNTSPLIQSGEFILILLGVVGLWVMEILTVVLMMVLVMEVLVVLVRMMVLMVIMVLLVPSAVICFEPMFSING